MNKIKALVDRETNFVFHMLSVARCGYDNAYGEKYRALHSPADLALLKANERLITVSGGEYCGELYGALVCRPAEGKMNAGEYYAALAGLLAGGDVSSQPNAAMLLESAGSCAAHKETAAAICRVFADNYAIFTDNVWENSLAELTPFARSVEAAFEESDFTERAEAMLNQRLESGVFYATLCNSLDYGAEAIDISPERDVFGNGASFSRSVGDEFHFIAHEYIIYLLKSALAATSAFSSFGTWGIVEGLAEYYADALLGESRFFNDQLEYIGFYKTEREKNPSISAAELYEKACAAYVKE